MGGGAGFAAGGSAGKASLLEAASPPVLPMLAPIFLAVVVAGVEDAEPPIQLGFGLLEDDAEALGRAGNAADEAVTGAEGRAPPPTTCHSGGFAVLVELWETTLPMLPRRVLFLSFSTLLAARACAALVALLWTAWGVAVTAEAQPLDEVVWPRMPPREGREG